MLPQLDPGVGLVAVRGQAAEGRAVGLDGQHGARGEVDAQADDVGRIDAALFQDGGDGALDHLDVVVGILERPIRFQRDAAFGQPRIDDAVGVVENRGRDLAPVGHIHEQRPARFSAEVDADCVCRTHELWTPLCWATRSLGQPGHIRGASGVGPKCLSMTRGSLALGLWMVTPARAGPAATKYSS